MENIILLPVNLNIRKDIIGFKEKHYEKYAWMIHTIISKGFESRETEHGYHNLKSEVLKKYLGNESKAIIQQLWRSKIIDVNSAYLPKCFSMSYRLTEKYNTSVFKRVKFVGWKADRYIAKYNNYHSCKLINLLQHPTIKQLHDNFVSVKIDKNAAMMRTDKLLVKGSIDINQHSCYKEHIQRVATGDLYFKQDSKTGRIYHNIAGFPRDLRQYLSYNGEQLHQVDVANCQPLLFLPFLDEYIRQNLTTLKYTSTVKPQLTYNPYVASFPSDVALYKYLTANGKFYEHLMPIFNVPQDTNSRALFKKTFFEKIFYARVPKKRINRYAKQFQAIFPTVYNAVLWHKRNGHAVLPIKLQKLEADIIIKSVCERLVAENGSTNRPFFVTVHDCIVCLEKDVAYIKGLVEQEINKVLGLIPKIKNSFY